MMPEKNKYVKVYVTDLRPGVTPRKATVTVDGKVVSGVGVRMEPPILMGVGDTIEISDRNGGLCRLEVLKGDA